MAKRQKKKKKRMGNEIDCSCPPSLFTPEKKYQERSKIQKETANIHLERNRKTGKYEARQIEDKLRV